MPIDSKGRFVSEETIPLIERFNKYIDKSSGCWIWTGYKNKGYGCISVINRPPQAAYRISWELYKGSIPEGLVVRHRCPAKRKDCCNPEHLKLGTQKDNMQDAIEDGTISRGERKHSSKLTEEQVIYFKKNLPNKGLIHQYCQEISIYLNIHTNTLMDIAGGRTWKHIP
jgi:hypothetical protein